MCKTTATDAYEKRRRRRRSRSPVQPILEITATAEATNIIIHHHHSQCGHLHVPGAVFDAHSVQHLSCVLRHLALNLHPPRPQTAPHSTDDQTIRPAILSTKGALAAEMSNSLRRKFREPRFEAAEQKRSSFWSRRAPASGLDSQGFNEGVMHGQRIKGVMQASRKGC